MKVTIEFKNGVTLLNSKEQVDTIFTHCLGPTFVNGFVGITPGKKKDTKMRGITRYFNIENISQILVEE